MNCRAQVNLQDDNYRRAVAALIKRVETMGQDWEKSLATVIAKHHLGLAQIADISRKAEQRWGAKTDLKSILAKNIAKLQERADLAWKRVLYHDDGADRSTAEEERQIYARLCDLIVKKSERLNDLETQQ